MLVSASTSCLGPHVDVNVPGMKRTSFLLIAATDFPCGGSRATTTLGRQGLGRHKVDLGFGVKVPVREKH